MKFIKELVGFSGCKVMLYNDNGNYFVRKISKSKDYNERLILQAEKQKYFLDNLASEKISTPQILNQGYIDDLYYFDMEYIQGISLIDQIHESKISDLREISDTLSIILKTMKKSRTSELIDLSSITSKVEDIMGLLSENSSAKDIIIDLKNMVIQMEKPTNINKTFCHGDLTMENIMFNKQKNKYYLIDFLDGFIDHYWFDITKLFQDIEGQWFKLRNPDINLHNMIPKMNFVNNFLRERVLNEEEIYLKNHYLLLAINFTRILPYAQDKDMNFLTSTIRKNIELAK